MNFKYRILGLSFFLALILISISDVGVSWATTPPGASYYTLATVTNPTANILLSNTPLQIYFPSNAFNQYEATNMINVEAFNTITGGLLNAYLEGNALNETQTKSLSSASNVIYWVDIPYNIIGNGNTQIGFAFAATSNNLLSSTVGTGVAPQLFNTSASPQNVYAQDNNCALVFTWCNVFQGTSLNASWVNFGSPSPAETIANGLTITGSSANWDGMRNSNTLGANQVVDELMNTIVFNVNYNLGQYTGNAATTSPSATQGFGVYAISAGQGGTETGAAGNYLPLLGIPYVLSFANNGHTQVVSANYITEATTTNLDTGTSNVMMSIYQQYDKFQVQWIRVRTEPANNQQPAIAFGSVQPTTTTSTTTTSTTSTTSTTTTSTSTTTIANGGGGASVFTQTLSCGVNGNTGSSTYNTNVITWVPNYHNFIVFTNFGNKCAFNETTPVGNVSYTYINQSLFGPLGQYVSYLTIQGYNSTGLVGNVPAYPYATGLLLPHITLNNKPYNALVIFFNQSIITPTYYWNNYVPVSCGPLGTICNTKTYSTQYNNFPFYQVTDYVTPSFINGTCQGFVYGSYNSTCTWLFNVTRPDLIEQYLSYPFLNVSLEYYPSDFKNLNIYRTTQPSNTIFGISSYGIFNNKEFLYSPDNQTFAAVINVSKYNILSYGIGAYSNYTLFSGANIIPARSSLDTQTQKAVLTVTTGNILPNLLTQIIVLPAYNDSFKNSTIKFNATPSIPTASFNNPPGWFYDYQYAMPVSNITFNYQSFNLSTYGQTGIHYITKSGLTLSTIVVPRKTEMGVNCNNINIFLDDYQFNTNTDLGRVPFYILNCTNTQLTLIVNKTTSLGYNYNSLYLYYNSFAGYGFSNSSEYNNYYYVASGSSFSLNPTPNNPEVIVLTAGLNGGSSISQSWGSGYGCYGSSGTYSYGYSLGVQYVTSGFTDCPGTFYDSNVSRYNVGNNTKQLIIYAGTLFTKNLYMGGIEYNDFDVANLCSENVCLSAGNTLANSGFFGLAAYEGSNFAVSLSGITGFVHNATGNGQVIIGKIIARPSNVTSCVINCPGSNRTIILPNSSNSAPNITSTGNLSKYIAKYSGTVLFFGQSLPQYYIIALGLVLVIALIIFMAMGDVWVTLVLLLGFWGSGILLAIAGNFDLTVVAVIVTIAYVVEHAHEWFG